MLDNQKEQQFRFYTKSSLKSHNDWINPWEQHTKDLLQKWVTKHIFHAVRPKGENNLQNNNDVLLKSVHLRGFSPLKSEFVYFWLVYGCFDPIMTGFGWFWVILTDLGRFEWFRVSVSANTMALSKLTLVHKRYFFYQLYTVCSTVVLYYVVSTPSP